MFDVIHIGYQKCGSTFFQRTLFPSLKEVQLTTANDFMHGLNFYDDRIFHLFCENEKISREKNYLRAENRINVYSSEILTHNYNNVSRTCERLKKISPDAKILVFVRNQVDYLFSTYLHRVRWGFGCDFYRYVNYLAVDDAATYGACYHGTLMPYLENFTNVKIIPFERLWREETLLDVLNYIGIDSDTLPFDHTRKVNANYSPLSHWIALMINRYSATKGQYFDPMDTRFYNLLRHGAEKIDSLYYRFGGNKEFEKNQEVTEYIHAYYAHDNARFQELFDFDIRELGYHY